MKKLTTTIVLALFTFVLSFGQVTIHVPDDEPTIQEAIIAADDGDTVLVAQGIYYENIFFYGKAIWLASHWLIEQDSAHILNTIIDGSAAANPNFGSTVSFTLGEDTTSVLCGFTIQGGTGTYNSAWNAWGGGGILVENASAKIIHNQIKDNHIKISGPSGYGGGLDIEPGDEDDLVIVRDNLIEGNQITNEGSTDVQVLGGGIELYLNNYIIERNVIRDNHLEGSGAMTGAGLQIGGAGKVGILMNNRIEENEIFNTGFVGTLEYPHGAGIDLVRQTPSESITILNNTITNNSIIASDSDGGGIFIYNNVAESDSLFIEGNVISNNKAARGGGMTMTLLGMGCYVSNNIISNNEADEFGGGIRIKDQVNYKSSTSPSRINPMIDGNQHVKKEGSAMVLVNNTIVNNTCAAEGGGIYNQSIENDLVLFNNIFYGNTGTNGADLAIDVSNFTTYLYNNNIGTEGIYGNWEGNENIYEDPGFYLNTHHLAFGSPCIDAGTDDVEVGGITYYAPEVDIDLDIRPNNGDFDIGADEWYDLNTSVRRAFDREEKLLSVFPNPVNSHATVEFNLQEPGKVELSLYDMKGRKMKTVRHELLNKGQHRVQLDTRILNGGIYMCTLRTDHETLTQKIIKLE